MDSMIGQINVHNSIKIETLTDKMVVIYFTKKSITRPFVG